VIHCICLDCLPIIPSKGFRIRPNPECPLHKTLAAKWDEIKNLDDFEAALAVDREA
jgi:hypothetical protein